MSKSLEIIFINCDYHLNIIKIAFIINAPDEECKTTTENTY